MQLEKVSGMLRSANEFLEISSNSKTFIPNFVNMAFACELYLKTILECKNVICNVHNLEILYGKAFDTTNEQNAESTEEDFLQLLCDEINADFNEMPHEEGYITICEGTTNAKDNLKMMFDRHKNLFVEWRYIYEGKIERPYSVDMTLEAFANTLKKYVTNMIDLSITFDEAKQKYPDNRT